MIDKKAKIGAGTVFGEYCVVEDGAEIGENCVIGYGAVIRRATKIGDGVRIDDMAVIGKLPMKAANSAVTEEQQLEGARIESGCLIGTHAVVYAGAKIAQDCLVADLATVRENVTIGEKTIIGRGVTIENGCSVGSFCKIETNAYLAAYSRVEDRCFIAPSVVTSNDNFAGRTRQRFAHFKGLRLRRGGRIGAGAVILPGREIGPDGFAAAGSVVTKDIPGGEIFAGNPAKKLRDVPPEQLLENQK